MNGDDYCRRQAERDREYEHAFETDEVKRWIASMPPQERRRLEADGLLEPLLQRHATGMSDHDMADSPLASEDPDIAAQIDEAAADREHPVVATTDHEALWDSLRRMLGELLNQKNAKLTLECFAVVSGASFLGDSMTAIARRHGVTRAAVSKRCIDIAKQLRLPPSRSMRAEKAREAYRKAQIEIHSQQNI